MSHRTSAIPGTAALGTAPRPGSSRSRAVRAADRRALGRLVGFFARLGSQVGLQLGLLLGLLLGIQGCVPINGGAFEADWVLFDDQGRAISDCGCSDPPIARVAFQIVGTGRYGSDKGSLPCAGQSTCVFSCQRHTGATPFDIPPGEYAFSLVALDGGGASLTGPTCTSQASGDASGDASTDSGAATDAMSGSVGVPRCVDAPAQILRQVVRGQAADVNALPLTTHCSDACSGASSGGVCAHP